MTETLYTPTEPTALTLEELLRPIEWHTLTPMEAQVKYELEESKESPLVYFNNLPDNISGGRRRKDREDRDRLDEPCRRPKEKWADWEVCLYSDRIAGKTYRDYYKDIDEAISAAAEDPESIFDLDTFEALKATRYDKDLEPSKKSAAIDKFSEYLLPIYAKMLEQGYSHYDIVQ